MAEPEYPTRETIQGLAEKNLSLKFSLMLYDSGELTWEQAMMLALKMLHDVHLHTIEVARKQIETAWKA